MELDPKIMYVEKNPKIGYIPCNFLVKMAQRFAPDKFKGCNWPKS